MESEWVKIKNDLISKGVVFPTLSVDYLEMPKIAEGIWHAQKAGWERVLTYDLVETSGEKKRQRAK